MNMRAFWKYIQRPRFTTLVVIELLLVTSGATWLTTVHGWRLFVTAPGVTPQGMTVATDGVELRVEGHRTDMGQEPLVPTPGNIYHVVTVHLANHRHEPVQIIPLLHFRLKDQDGRVYDVQSIPSLPTQVAGPLLPGDILQEDLAFETPNTVSQLTLYYEPGIEAQDVTSDTAPGHLRISAELGLDVRRALLAVAAEPVYGYNNYLCNSISVGLIDDQ